MTNVYSEMVERVAIKIAFERVVAFERLPPFQQEMLRREARAAIAAMREPTAAMLDRVEYDSHGWALQNWQAMIDEALK